MSFEERVEQLAARAAWSAEHRQLEADLRSDLAQVLVPFAREIAGIPDSDIRQEGLGVAGRFDSMFGSAIVEYKAPRLLRSARERENAAVQGLDYLHDPSLGARAVILTDGEKWAILRDVEVAPELGGQLTLDFGSPTEELPAIARFAWRENSLATTRAVLYLVESQRALPVTAKNFVAYLGTARTEVVTLIHQLGIALGRRTPSSRTDVLFAQWVRTAGIAYGIKDVNADWPRPGRTESLTPTLAGALSGRTYAETVFVLHSYLALAAKCVAAEVLAIQKQRADRRPSQWPRFSDAELIDQLLELENGVTSEELGAPGLLSSDLFDWYSHEARSDAQLRSAVRGFLVELARLGWAHIATAGGMKIDLLRDLYQETVPRVLRRSLGEFFTPRWLAEYVFARTLQIYEEAQHRGEGVTLPRVLDPSCGSGTFLVAAIRVGLQRLDFLNRGSDPQALEELIEGVIGIDINPVSALMSRVNLLLALGERLSYLPEVHLQVFHADSIIPPRIVAGQMQLGSGGDVVTVTTAIKDFEVARDLMARDRMAVLRHNLEAGVRGRFSDDIFVNLLVADFAQAGWVGAMDNDAVRNTALGLYRELTDLSLKGLDDVWARVLEQFVAPYLLDEVDIVVGNPPWVSWKNLPDSWKERSAPIWRSWGLWRSRGRQGIPLSDISTLLAAQSMANYAPHGVVGLLLPQSAQLADPGGRSFRRGRLRPEPQDRTHSSLDADLPYQVVAGDDFVEVNPFAPDASNRTIAFYMRPGSENAFPIPMRVWRRQPRARLSAAATWPKTEGSLTKTDAELEPVERGESESPWGLRPPPASLPLQRAAVANYAFGRGYETRGADGVYTFTILTPTPVGPTREIRVRNDPAAGRNTRGLSAREGVVEAGLFWPLVKGEDVSKWRVERTGKVFFVPYEHAAGNTNRVTTSDCASRFPNLFRYLSPWIDIYKERSMYARTLSAEFPWELSGPIEHLSSEGALVFVRYLATSGRPAAAVRLPEYEPSLDRTTLPIPNNKSNIFYTTVEDEAFYLAAFINSEPAQAALSRFAVSTGVTPAALGRLPMPSFDGTNPHHRALARLGREANRIVNGGAVGLEEVELAINDAIWEAAGVKPADAPQVPLPFHGHSTLLADGRYAEPDVDEQLQRVAEDPGTLHDEKDSR